MSSSSWSTDEPASGGRGYADGAMESLSSPGSSIYGSEGDPDWSENVPDEVELNVDNSLEWSGATPHPPVNGYDWAPHEVCGYFPYFTTNASIMYLVERVSLLANIKDAENISLVVCRANEQAYHGREGYCSYFFYVHVT